LVLELVDTLVSGLACITKLSVLTSNYMCPTSRTISSTLWRWSLAATTTDSNAVDNVALLGLVSETASLVWAGWTRCAVDNVQLSEPTVMHFSAMFNEVTSAQLQRCKISQCSLDCRLTPSSGHGEGSGAHHSASSFEAPRRI
jgi:hypothetical protein